MFKTNVNGLKPRYLFLGAGAGAGAGVGAGKKMPGAGQKWTGSATLNC